MQTDLLEARVLTKRHSDTLALDGPNFTVAAGETLCLLGANGAGKTTTLNLFPGFPPPTSGQALVTGHDVALDPGAIPYAGGAIWMEAHSQNPARARPIPQPRLEC